MSTVSLTNLLVPSKEVTVEYPGMPGFEVKLKFLSRELLQKLRKQSTKITFKKHNPVEELDDEAFLDLYVKETVIGWTGLKLKYLEKLAPIDLGGVENKEIELPFSEEEAIMLMRNSTDFDNFVSEKVQDLGNFSTGK